MHLSQSPYSEWDLFRLTEVRVGWSRTTVAGSNILGFQPLKLTPRRKTDLISDTWSDQIVDIIRLLRSGKNQMRNDVHLTCPTNLHKTVHIFVLTDANRFILSSLMRPLFRTIRGNATSSQKWHCSPGGSWLMFVALGVPNQVLASSGSYDNKKFVNTSQIVSWLYALLS